MMVNLRTISHIFFIVASIIALSSCNNTRFLQSGETLFKNNKITIVPDSLVEENKRPFKKELTDISLLQPNKKLLGTVKIRLWFFNVAGKHRQNKFRYWLRNKVGEPPVLFDSAQAIRSTELIQNYLVNKGYFYATVGYEVQYKKKRAALNYIVTPGKLYSINHIYYPTDTSDVSKIINAHKAETKLKPKTPFSVSDLKAERERIADDLRNNGYFYFNKEYVSFDIDSSKGGQLLDLYVHILPPTDSTNHQKYYINQVYIYPDYSIDQYKHTPRFDTISIGEYWFISERLRYKPMILINALHFNHDSLYSKKDNALTINHLADLGVFKFINVKFEPVKDSTHKGKLYLNCIITLTAAKRQEIAFDAQINNNSNYLLGVSLSNTYRNKNLFKGAELFEFNVTGGLQTNFQKGQSFFTTADASTYTNLYFNKFLVPFKFTKFARNYRPKTKLSFKYNFLRRIQYYTVTTSNLTFGYDWKQSLTKRHQLNIANISLVRVLEKSAAFDTILSKSQTLRNSFNEQLIVGANYAYLWSNKAKEHHYGYFTFRGDVEVAGNLVHALSIFAHIGKHDSPPYTLFGVPYAQYIEFNGDLRNYYTIGPHAKLATRLLGGLGIPYGNSNGLPYVKQFFGGGTNDIRAWTIRTLGPGSFIFNQSAVSNNNNFFYDETGDLKMEANAELRFDIYKFIKAAIFVDAGNIWTLKADSLRPGANFDVTRFASEIAIGSGFGLRFDFSYFVFRLDLAFPIHDPGAVGDRWVIKNFDPTDKTWRSNNLKLNLAIGYPF